MKKYWAMYILVTMQFTNYGYDQSNQRIIKVPKKLMQYVYYNDIRTINDKS